MAQSRLLSTSSVSVNNVLWTPLRISRACAKVIVYNQGADNILMRTDEDDSDTQIVIGPGQQYAAESATQRFMVNDIVAFFQSTTPENTGPIKGLEQS